MTYPPLAIGIDIGGTKIAVGLINTQGEVKKKFHFSTEAKKGYSHTESLIIEAVNELKKESLTPLKTLGIGIAGQVEKETGVVLFAPNLGWKNVPLKENLTKKLFMDVSVMNDVRAATIAEWKLGNGRGAKDLVCLFIGTGVGGGVVSNGRLLFGANNSAAELGHIVIQMNGEKCSCGNLGCLEAYLGGWAIERDANACFSKQMSAKEVVELFRKKDPHAEKILTRAKEAFAQGSISIVNAFNPSHLILGGGILEGMPEWIEHIKEQIHLRALDSSKKNLSILPAFFLNDAVMIGSCLT